MPGSALAVSQPRTLLRQAAVGIAIQCQEAWMLPQRWLRTSRGFYNNDSNFFRFSSVSGASIQGAGTFCSGYSFN